MSIADIPWHAFDHELLLKEAQRVLADREAAYPSYVTKGEMTADEADAGLRIARAIVADRQRVVDLRADRPTQAVDATATDTEKRRVTAYVHERALVQRDKAEAAFKALLDNSALGAFEQDIMTYQAIRAAYLGKWQGWGLREIGIWLAAEERTWRTHALHWHTERWPMDMLNAEMRHEQIARNIVPRAA